MYLMIGVQAVKNPKKWYQRLLHVWHGMDQSVIDNAIDELRGCLRARVGASVGHFEQLLW